jgi:hypothetical protein
MSKLFYGALATFVFTFVVMVGAFWCVFRKEWAQAWREYKAEKTLLKVQTELFDK